MSKTVFVSSHREGRPPGKDPQLKSILLSSIPAILLTLAFVAANYLIFGMRYEVNDDAIISNIASGAYGVPTQYLVYVNVLFGFLLKPFYAIIPWLNWFVVFLVGLAVLCFITLGTLLCRRWGVARGLMLHLVLLLLAGQDLFARFHYVKYGALFIATGMVLVVLHLGRLNFSVFAGIALAFAGSLMRFDQFIASGGMAAALLLWVFFKKLDGGGKKRAAIAMAALLAVCFGAYGADVLAYESDEGWAYFRRYNAARTEISDMRMHFAGSAEVLEPLGCTQADYDVLYNWMFYDPEVFPVEKLEEIGAALPYNTAGNTLLASAQTLVKTLFGKPVHVLFSAVLLAWLLLGSKKRWPALVGTLGLLAAMTVYLNWLGRYLQRVDFALVLTAAIYCTLCFEPKATEGAPTPGPRAKRAELCWALLLTGVLAISMGPAYSGALADWQDYRQSRPPRASDLDALSADKEHLYLLDPDFIDAANGYSVWHARPKDYFSNMVFVGSWLMESPLQNGALAAYGLENPWRDSINSPTAIVVDMYHQDIRTAYLRQHYGEGITLQDAGEGNTYRLYTVASEGANAE